MNDPTVLITDDNPEHVELTSIAIELSGRAVGIRSCGSGEAALEYLARCMESGTGGAFPVPALILLDLVLPGLSGFETLERIRSDPRLAAIPVVILSTSENPSDVEKGRRLNADGFVSKSCGAENYFKTVRDIINQWIPGEGL